MKFPMEQLVLVVSCPVTVHPRGDLGRALILGRMRSFSITTWKVLEEGSKVEAQFLREVDTHHFQEISV